MITVAARPSPGQDAEHDRGEPAQGASSSHHVRPSVFRELHVHVDPSARGAPGRRAGRRLSVAPMAVATLWQKVAIKKPASAGFVATVGGGLWNPDQRSPFCPGHAIEATPPRDTSGRGGSFPSASRDAASAAGDTSLALA